MNDKASTLELKTVDNRLNQRLQSKKIMPLFVNWRFLGVVFIVLLLWHFAAQFIAVTDEGQHLASSDRATTFAKQLTSRLMIVMFFWVIVTMIRLCIDSKSGSLLADISGNIKMSLTTDPTRLARAALFFALGCISFIWLQTNFMTIKTSITNYVPFYMDEVARDLDKALFFGRDPYTYFSWLYNMPLAMSAIDKTYTFWAAFVAGTWLYCFTSERMSRQRRFQYVFAMIFLWVIAGNLLAMALSSAGPCYYGEFTGNFAAYAPLMTQLDAVNSVNYIDAFVYQSFLLEMHNNPAARYGGISAMPSLHVGASIMMLILFWKTRIAREALIAFNIVIYVGSIVLAWHYAIDGIIVIPVALLCWWLGGKLSTYLESISASAAPLKTAGALS